MNGRFGALMAVVFLILSGSISARAQGLQCLDIFSGGRAHQKFVIDSQISEVEGEIQKMQNGMPAKPAWYNFGSARKVYKDAQADLAVKESELKRLIDITEDVKKAVEVQKLSALDEAQLISRMLNAKNKKKYRAALNGILSQSEAQRSAQEQDFLTSSFYYMIWGPDVSLFTMPFHHWVLLHMFDSHTNSSYSLQNDIKALNQTVEAYQGNLSHNEAVPEVITHDPIVTSVQEENRDVAQVLQEVSNDPDLVQSLGGSDVVESFRDETTIDINGDGVVDSNDVQNDTMSGDSTSNDSSNDSSSDTSYDSGGSDTSSFE